MVRETRTQQFTTTDGKTAVRAKSPAPSRSGAAYPRQAAEMVQFGIDNGVLRAAVISAQAVTHVSGAPEPSLGVMWNDDAAFVETQRQQALGDSDLPPLYGPGAADLILAAGPTPPSGSGPSSTRRCRTDRPAVRAGRSANEREAHMVLHPTGTTPQLERSAVIWSMRGGDGKTPMSVDVAGALELRAAGASRVVGGGVLERVRLVVPAGDDAAHTVRRRTLTSGRG